MLQSSENGRSLNAQRILELDSRITQLQSELSELKQASKPPLIVVRVDDIQDFAYRDSQLFLLRYNIASGIPMSLAAIPGMLGSDIELVRVLCQAIQSGSEIAAHGWLHEELAKLPLNEQQKSLAEARERLRVLFGVNTTILVPPKFSFNGDTPAAMRTTGFKVISSDISLQEPGIVSEGIVSFPSTVSFSRLINGTWQLRSMEDLSREVVISIGRYGYAVILLHPQEFSGKDGLNEEAVMIYENLMQRLKENYSFTVITQIKDGLIP